MATKLSIATVKGPADAEHVTLEMLQTLFGSITAQDAGPAQTVTRTVTTSADMSTAAAITPAPTSGQNLYALDIVFSTDTAGNVKVQEETSTTALTNTCYVAANCGNQSWIQRGMLKAPTADKKMFGKHSAAGNISWLAITYSA